MSQEFAKAFLKILEKSGAEKDSHINLTDSALAMAAIQNSVASIERYQNHIRKLIDEVKARHALLIEEGADDDAATQLAALKHIIADKHEYVGDKEKYDDLQNVNLIRVIERRKGMPVALALIYIHVAQAQGWQVEALSLPAHVVCRVEKDGTRLLFDPFDMAKVLQASDLRNLLKELIGPEAELSSTYYDASTKRDLLIRMQNNIKLRQIEGEDYLGALKTIDIMRLIAPNEYRLLFDAGVLYARTNQAVAAIDMLEEYIEQSPNIEDQNEAFILLQQIKNDLH